MRISMMLPFDFGMNQCEMGLTICRDFENFGVDPLLHGFMFIQQANHIDRHYTHFDIF